MTSDDERAVSQSPIAVFMYRCNRQASDVVKCSFGLPLAFFFLHWLSAAASHHGM
jgi:hypothetical protein